MRNDKYVISIILIFVFSSLGLAYNNDHLYKRDLLESKFESYLPQNWYASQIEIGYLDSENNASNNKENIIVLAKKTNSVSYSIKEEYFFSNQLYVFEWEGENLALVWKSEIYVGYTTNMDFTDIDNNGKKNINISIDKKDSDETYRTLLVFDWDGQNTKLIYPLGSMEIIKNDYNFQFFDYDYDNDVEIIVTEILKPHKQYKDEYYLLKDGQLILEKEEIITVQQETENKISSQYPLINTIVEENSTGELYDVINLQDNLYLVKIKIKDFKNESTNLIIEEEEGKYSLKYRLDKRMNGFGYREDRVFDFNNDDYIEVIFINNFYGEYYIVSFRSDKPKLLTPINEDFSSPLRIIDKLNDIGIIFHDKDEDGIPELVSEDFGDYGIIPVYWKWNSSKDCYEIYSQE